MFEFEGLFDVRINQDEETLLTYWRDEPTAIRFGEMGYRRRTVKAGERLDAEIYPVFGKRDLKEVRAARANATPEAMQKLNIRNATRKLIQLIEANFGKRDISLGLSYRDTAPDDERVRKDLRNFLNKIKRLRKKRGLPELKYIYAIGGDEMPSRGYSGKRPHIHIIMNGGIDRDELESIWARGYANCDRLQPNDEGLEGLAKYMIKQRYDRPERKNAKKWSRSKNLKRPWRRTSDCEIGNAKVKRIAYDFKGDAKEVMEKLYPGYRFVKCEVYQSDVVDGVYIRCVMRKNQEDRRR